MTTPSPAPVSVPSTAITPTGPPATAPAAVSPTVDTGIPVTTQAVVPRSQIDRAPAAVTPGPGTGTTGTGTNTTTISIAVANIAAPATSATGNNIVAAAPKPGGNSGAIQFNNNSTFAGGANLTFDGVKIQSIGYGVPLLTTMYDSLAGGILNATGEVRVGNINTNASQTGSAGLGRLRYQRSGPVPGGAAGQVAFYGFKAKDNQFTTLTFENNNLSSVALVMGATAPYDASGVPGYVGFGGNGTVFGISGSYYVSPGGANRMSNGGASENWSPFLNLDGRGNLTIGGGITMTPPAFRPWFTAGGRNDPDGPAINCGITFADGTFQNTAAVISLTVQEEGSNVVVNTNTINFVGNGVVASNVAGIATITIAGSNSSSGITVQEEGANTVTSANTINFVGSSVTTSNVAGVATITVASGLSGIAVQEEGANTVTSANTINFVGSSVTTSNVAGVATITVASGLSGIAVQEEGSNVVASANTVNFIGNLVTASNVGGVATVTVNGPAVQEEGSNVVASTSTLNFVGAGVTASNVSGVATITISGGGSGITVQEESSTVLATATTLNFLGNGVTASNIAGVAIITVPGGITVNDDQSFVIQTDTISFNGPLVAATNSLNVQADIQVGLTVQDEGNVITGNAAIGTLNFLGAGVTVTAGTTGVANVTIPGSVSGTVSTLTSNITLNSTYVSGTILKWVNGDILITAPSTANGAIPVGSTINIFNASQTGNANIFADVGNAVLVGPRPNAEGILSYVQVGPFEQVTVVNLGPSAGNVEAGKTMWFCYGSAYPLGVAYP